MVDITIEQLTTELSRLGLLSQAAEEVLASLDRQRDHSGGLDLLVSSGCLTNYQSEQLAQGKGQGLIIDNYIVLDLIGRGGMGEVYRAIHRYLDREVALKTIRSESADRAELIERFRRESKLLAKLDHPNIVAAHDAGEWNGELFLVTELLPSITLQKLVERHGPLPLRNAVKYSLDVCKGLEYAHQRQIIHRDIKPSNLLLANNDTIKILDLGLAKLTSRETHSADLTNDGALLGTIDYMSPEQAAGEEATALSDLYSLGCSFFFFLTGRTPWIGLPPLQRIVAHTREKFPEVSQFRPDVPESLEKILLKLCARQPRDRYENAGQARREFAQCLRSLTSLTRRKPSPVPDRDNSYPTLPPLSQEEISTTTRNSTEVDSTVIGHVRIDTTPERSVRDRRKVGRRSFKYPLSVIFAGSAVGLLLVIVIWKLASTSANPSDRSFENRSQIVPEGGRDSESLREGVASNRPTGESRDSAAETGLIKIGDLGDPIEIEAEPGGMQLILFTKDSRWMLTGGWDQTFRVWDVATQAKKWEKSIESSAVTCGVFLDDGRHFALGTYEGTIEIWNWETRTRERSFQAHKKELFRMTSCGANRIVSGAEDAAIYMWNTLTGAKLNSQLEHKYDVGSVVYVESENAIYSGGGDGWLRCWNLNDDSVSVFQETDEVTSLGYDPHRNTLYAGLASQFVAWDLTERKERFRHQNAHKGDVWSMAISPDGRFVATGGNHSDLIVWDAETGEQLTSRRDGKHKNHDVNTIAFSPDLKWLATGSDDGILRLWYLK